MARPRDNDERFVVPDLARVPEVSRYEHIWLSELAEYLQFSVRRVKRFAKERGLLRYAGQGASKPSVPYVNAYGAMRIMVWVRAQQGAKLVDEKRTRARRASTRSPHLRGDSPHVEASRQREHLALAISGGGAETAPEESNHGEQGR